MKQDQIGTIVGSSVHLTGAIKDSSDITIFGSVEGEVVSDTKVIIEESAYVKGPVTANEIVLSGFVNGTVTAKQKLELNASGTIKGNIETEDLLIHSGATFIGKCNMPDKKEGGAPGNAESFEVDVEGEETKDQEGEEEEE